MKFALGIALALSAPVASAQQWLPDHAQAHAAIDAQPEVAAARARVESARAQARAQAAGPYEVELELAGQRRSSDEGGLRQRYSESEVSIGRTFRLPGKAALDRRVGAAMERGAQLRLEEARHQAALRLLDAWMDWVDAADRRRRADAELSLLDAAARDLERRVQAGESARKDADLLGVEQAQARARRLAADGAVAVANAALHGTFPGLRLPTEPAGVAAPLPLAGDAAAWSQRISARSHALAASSADADGADARAARARAERLPDPTVSLRRMSERGGAEHVQGLVLSLPLGGRYRAATAAAATADAAALRDDHAAIRRDIDREAALSVAAAVNLSAQWKAHQAALDASATALGRVRRGWELGEVALSEWLLVQRQHGQIAAAEADARADAERARLRVLVDAHDIWQDD